jgi:hypothetical protein
MGETLQIFPNAFVDNSTGEVIEGQKIFVYAATTGSGPLDIGQSNAHI